jgi:hypothetical protein
MYNANTVTAMTRKDSSPRKNHSRKPLIASTLGILPAGPLGAFGRVA